MKKNLNYISSEELYEFSLWLLDQNLRGYALLVLHGSQLGLRMSKQLKLTWGDFIDKDLKVKLVLKVKGDKDRRMGELVKRITQEANTSNDRLDSPIYTTSSNQPIESYNLRRDLSRYYYDFRLSDREFRIYDPKFFSPQILEIAWMRDFLFDNNLHPNAFKELSKHLKHNNVGYTIEMVGLTPVEPKPYDMRYDYVENKRSLQGTIKRPIWNIINVAGETNSPFEETRLLLEKSIKELEKKSKREKTKK